jgi:hypothetical protein
MSSGVVRMEYETIDLGNIEMEDPCFVVINHTTAWK